MCAPGPSRESRCDFEGRRHPTVLSVSLPGCPMPASAFAPIWMAAAYRHIRLHELSITATAAGNSSLRYISILFRAIHSGQSLRHNVSVIGGIRTPARGE